MNAPNTPQPLPLCSNEDAIPLKAGLEVVELREERWWPRWEREPKPLRSCGMGVTPDCDPLSLGKPELRKSMSPVVTSVPKAKSVATLLSQLQWSPAVPTYPEIGVCSSPDGLSDHADPTTGWQRPRTRLAPSSSSGAGVVF